jgi:hypothetical protein
MSGYIANTFKVIAAETGISIRQWMAPKEAVQYAIDRETTFTHGDCVGLTHEQTEMVVSTMLDWYQGWNRGPSWDEIRSRLTLCAMDLEWRP